MGLACWLHPTLGCRRLYAAAAAEAIDLLGVLRQRGSSCEEQYITVYVKSWGLQEVLVYFSIDSLYVLGK